MPNESVSTESFASEVTKPTKGPKLRLAIIGCGGISETHLKALKTMADVEVVAGVDIKPERLDVMREKYGIPELFEDWNEMLEKVAPDAVSVCTPNGVHAPATIAAAKAGCHVITEKPMAMNPAECQQMIDAAKDAGKLLVCGFQFRYHPNTQMLVRAREEDQFGDIMFVKCQALRRRGIPNWGVFGQKELQGGGPMIDIGVHVIEMAHYTMGSPKPVAASGNVWTYLGDKSSNVVSQWPGWDWETYTVEDLAIGQIRFENGAVMQIEASFAAHIEKDVWNFTMIGDKGGARWDPTAIFTDRAGTMTNTTAGFLPKADFHTLFISKLRNFVDGCLHGKQLECPGEAGMAVQKILDGVYRSAEAGSEVTID
ncbi:MAG: Gfo/Idh/MocA family oxidoreductase [Lentisphaerae bacterium]|jgi:predicted dehydrogenase|nr:Gfo/Idh/MocA family oxidoreductase [Lentisphaerota bacterium]MBT4822629.1 Gfo/Idh/MocA family oxidoreductase [Lentisphaerota bacterium]MBT5610293.1 Gfo/Idh/MocA family oxidoreductase [Lentisphaerota bacterium]MBT7056416.1 Gfo/Idh/MocA family oxidoreductase [Lentisphaerota bacterium]MBT7848212.1 Gfo/Idh/MocA family oxidoreductase [Lentisphaerota bacterium]